MKNVTQTRQYVVLPCQKVRSSVTLLSPSWQFEPGKGRRTAGRWVGGVLFCQVG